MLTFKNEILEDGVCVHCETEEQATALLNWADEQGRTWHGGVPFTKDTNWTTYKERTVYYIKEGMYGDTGGAMQDSDMIIPFKEALIKGIEYNGKIIAFPELSAQLKDSV